MIFKKYFLHLPQWTCITYLITEEKHLHMGQQIHSTLQNCLTWRQFSLRSLFIKKQFVFLLILKTLDYFLTLDTNPPVSTLYFSLSLMPIMCQALYEALYHVVSFMVPENLWGCYYYSDTVTKEVEDGKLSQGKWTAYGSFKFKFKSSLVWLKNSELQNTWQLINCLFQYWPLWLLIRKTIFYSPLYSL